MRQFVELRGEIHKMKTRVVTSLLIETHLVKGSYLNYYGQCPTINIPPLTLLKDVEMCAVFCVL